MDGEAGDGGCLIAKHGEQPLFFDFQCKVAYNKRVEELKEAGATSLCGGLPGDDSTEQNGNSGEAAERRVPMAKPCLATGERFGKHAERTHKAWCLSMYAIIRERRTTWERI